MQLRKIKEKFLRTGARGISPLLYGSAVFPAPKAEAPTRTFFEKYRFKRSLSLRRVSLPPNGNTKGAL